MCLCDVLRKVCQVYDSVCSICNNILIYLPSCLYNPLLVLRFCIKVFHHLQPLYRLRSDLIQRTNSNAFRLFLFKNCPIEQYCFRTTQVQFVTLFFTWYCHQSLSLSVCTFNNFLLNVDKNYKKSESKAAIKIMNIANSPNVSYYRIIYYGPNTRNSKSKGRCPTIRQTKVKAMIMLSFTKRRDRIAYFKNSPQTKICLLFKKVVFLYAIWHKLS